MFGKDEEDSIKSAQRERALRGRFVLLNANRGVGGSRIGRPNQSIVGDQEQQQF